MQEIKKKKKKKLTGAGTLRQYWHCPKVVEPITTTKSSQASRGLAKANREWQSHRLHHSWSGGVEHKSKGHKRRSENLKNPSKNHVSTDSAEGSSEVGFEMRELLVGWLIRGNAVSFDDCLWVVLVAWHQTTRQILVWLS